MGKIIGSLGFFAFGMREDKNQMSLNMNWLFQDGIQLFYLSTKIYPY